jgi:hypothetical protein
MRFATAVLAVSLALAGCHIGTRAERFDPARKPEGVGAEIQVRGKTLNGELLEVGASSLLLLAQRQSAGRVVLVPYAAIEDAQFRQMSSCRIRSGLPPEAAVRERLRQVSRFPQGLAPELLQRMLEDLGQSEPETLRP